MNFRNNGKNFLLFSERKICRQICGQLAFSKKPTASRKFGELNKISFRPETFCDLYPNTDQTGLA